MPWSHMLWDINNWKTLSSVGVGKLLPLFFFSPGNLPLVWQYAAAVWNIFTKHFWVKQGKGREKLRYCCGLHTSVYNLPKYLFVIMSTELKHEPIIISIQICILWSALLEKKLLCASKLLFLYHWENIYYLLIWGFLWETNKSRQCVCFCPSLVPSSYHNDWQE